MIIIWLWSNGGGQVIVIDLQRFRGHSWWEMIKIIVGWQYVDDGSILIVFGWS